MTGKTFLNRVANGESDVVQLLLSLLEETGSAYCVIGGLAVNAYADPVVSLDLDLVVSVDCIPELRLAAESKGMKIEDFEHIINFNIVVSGQFDTDNDYV